MERNKKHKCHGKKLCDFHCLNIKLILLDHTCIPTIAMYLFSHYFDYYLDLIFFQSKGLAKEHFHLNSMVHKNS